MQNEYSKIIYAILHQSIWVYFGESYKKIYFSNYQNVLAIKKVLLKGTC